MRSGWLMGGAVSLIALAGSQSLFAQGIDIPEDQFTYDGTCPNAAPDYCDCTEDLAGFAAAWPAVPGFNSGTVKSDFANCATNSGFSGWSAPFAYFHGKGDTQMNMKDLGALAAAIDPTKNAVNGTDANPLVLTMYFWTSSTNGKEDNTSMYVQLFAGDSMAPVTRTIEDPLNPGTFIETRLTFSFCGSNNSYSVPRDAIAFGFHGGSTGLSPKIECGYSNFMVYQNVIYDGDKWMALKSNYPTTGDQINASKKHTRLVMTIKTSTIDLEVTNADTPGVTMTRFGIPRQYLGAFTTLAIGSSVASDYPAYADDVALTGGELAYVVPTGTGACCKPDYTCEALNQTDCEAIEGAVFHGVDTECGVGPGRCCGDLAVDGDHDTDVDMDDFAKLQRCITLEGAVASECACFDTNEDGTIDATDVDRFALCASGSGVTADITCDDEF